MEMQVEIWLLEWLQMESSYHNTSITPLIYSSEEVGHCQKDIVFFKITLFTKLISMKKKFLNAPHDFFLKILFKNY